VLVAGALATYAIVAWIVKASTMATTTQTVRVMPFKNVSDITYDKYAGERLQFITATVALELRKLCEQRESVSWGTMQRVLAQCPALERDKDEINVVDRFGGNLSEASVKTWLYEFLRKTDADVFNASRIHESSINEVVGFVQKSSVDFGVFSDTVFKSYDLLDIGLIRFPTKATPYIKIYRLQLSGYFSGSRFMMISHGANRALSVTVSSRKYHPRDDLLKRLAPEMVQTTLAHFEQMLT
jgi:hypothetical protein